MPSNKNFKERISKGLCGFCGLKTLVNKTECEECRSLRRNQQKSAYTPSKLDALREQWKNRTEQGLCVRCGKENIESTKTCRPCLNKQQIRESKLKDAVFHFYGGYTCFCCGETIKEFLTLDHIQNDGAKHRKELKNKNSGKNLYRWIIDNEFPPIFQVACYNCNCGRKHDGVCPHKKYL